MNLLWQWWDRSKPRWDNSILEDVVDRAIVFGALAMGFVALCLYISVDSTQEVLPELGVVTQAKNVRRRSVRSLLWTSLSTGSPIHQGDALKTESGGQITIALNNKQKLELPGSALVKINGITKSHVELMVYQGSLAEVPGIIQQQEPVVEPLRRPSQAVLAIPLVLSPSYEN